MIKFFRKIRQKLLMENKTSKYFKYAIGEIILVVIGILIALSLNNWKEDLAKQGEEKRILSGLKQEFEGTVEDPMDYESMDRDSYVNEKFKKKNFILLYKRVLDDEAVIQSCSHD